MRIFGAFLQCFASTKASVPSSDLNFGTSNAVDANPSDMLLIKFDSDINAIDLDPIFLAYFDTLTVIAKNLTSFRYRFKKGLKRLYGIYKIFYTFFTSFFLDCAFAASLKEHQSPLSNPSNFTLYGLNNPVSG